MSKEKKNVKKIPHELLLAKYFEGRTYKRNKIYRVNVDGISNFMIITDDGFEIYFASKVVSGEEEVLGKVELKYSFSWTDFTSVTLDKFALSTLYQFNTGFSLRVDASSDLTEELRIHGVQVTFLERKWYNKILGFRSKKKWKMTVACLGYLFLFAFLVGLFSDNDKPAEQASAPVNSGVNSEVKSTENNSKKQELSEVEKQKLAEEEAKKKAEAEAKKKAEEEAMKTPQQKMLESISGLIGAKQAFDAGSYIKGDIPAGEYAFITFPGGGKYYSEKDPAGNIIDNENFDSFGYVYVNDTGNLETRGVLVSTAAFGTLGVSSAKQIYETLNKTENYKDAGWYKVGVDIQPGQYVIESYGQGYVAVMAGPVGKSDIVDNENFNGRYSVNVKNGQYLKISRAKIAQ